MGHPSIAARVYCRCFLLEGIDSERGIAYRVLDSLNPREFMGLSLEEQTPDHSRLSKTRRLMNLGTHKALFRWVLKRLVVEGLLGGKQLGVDATTLEASAALKSIVRRNNGAGYEEHVTESMKTEGMEEPTPAERQRFDRKRKKSLSNRGWVNPHDREARITKMKDGLTHLACKVEHAVDLETGAVVAPTVQPADCGDTASRPATLAEAGRTVTEMAEQAAKADAVGPVETVSAAGVERVLADKGYHSKQAFQDLVEVEAHTVIAKPERKRQQWPGQSAAQAAGTSARRGPHRQALADSCGRCCGWAPSGRRQTCWPHFV
jgi:transposase